VDGDVVLAVDGAAVRSFAELAAHLATRQLGDVVTLQARRADVEMSVRVELARWPDASAALAPLLVESRAVLAGSTNAFGLAGAARPAASPWVLSAGAPPGPR
jgi:PDZ domain-containing secreted protein